MTIILRCTPSTSGTPDDQQTPPTSQPTDNNPLTNLQDRQRAPQQQLNRCLEDGTRIDLSLSEISDEEVDYGSFESSVNPSTDSDHQWSTSGNDS